MEVTHYIQVVHCFRLEAVEMVGYMHHILSVVHDILFGLRHRAGHLGAFRILHNKC